MIYVSQLSRYYFVRAKRANIINNIFATLKKKMDLENRSLIDVHSLDKVKCYVDHLRLIN